MITEQRRSLGPVQLQNKADYWNILSQRLDLPKENNGMYTLNSLQLLIKKSDAIQQIPRDALKKMRNSTQLVASLESQFLVAMLECYLEEKGQAPLRWETGSPPPIDYICRCIDYLDKDKKLDIWKRPPQDFTFLQGIHEE